MMLLLPKRMNDYEDSNCNEDLQNLDILKEEEAKGKQVSIGKVVAGASEIEIAVIGHGVGMIGNVEMHVLWFV